MSSPNRNQGMVWWVLLLLYAASWSAALLTPYPLQIRDALVPEEYGFSAGKTLHVVAYAVFAILTGMLPSWRRTVLVLVILHGPLTEFLQQFTERTGSLRDVGLDWLGVTLGVLLTWKRWRQQEQ